MLTIVSWCTLTLLHPLPLLHHRVLFLFVLNYLVLVLDILGLLLQEGIVRDVGLGFAGDILNWNQSMPHGAFQVELHFDEVMQMG